MKSFLSYSFILILLTAISLSSAATIPSQHYDLGGRYSYHHNLGQCPQHTGMFPPRYHAGVASRLKPIAQGNDEAKVFEGSLVVGDATEFIKLRVIMHRDGKMELQSEPSKQYLKELSRVELAAVADHNHAKEFPAWQGWWIDVTGTNTCWHESGLTQPEVLAFDINCD